MNFPQEPTADMRAATISMRAMYVGFTQAGFTEKDALYLVGQAVHAMFEKASET